MDRTPHKSVKLTNVPAFNHKREFMYDLSIAGSYFSRKNMMPGGSVFVIRHCRRVLFNAVKLRNTSVSVTFIAKLIWFVTTSLVYENKNNGDKFYR